MSPGPRSASSFREQKALHALLDRAIAIEGAAKGNVQWIPAGSDVLEIVAQRGFNAGFLQLFQQVRSDEPSVCARAVRHGQRVSVPDLTMDFHFAPYLSVARENEFCAVQSTPIYSPDGRLCGVLSTHFAAPHRLTETGGAALDEVARKMGMILGR